MPDASTDTLLRISRPTFTVGGQDNAPLAGGLLSMVVAENTQGLYRCEAKFGNLGPADGGRGPEFLYFDRRTLDFGKAFQVKLGTALLFDGRISGLEAHFPDGGAPPEITALAEDRFQDLRMTRRTTTFSDVSDADVIQQIASQHGLSADVNVEGPTYKVLAQLNQSDLAFLRERARAVEAELWLEGTTLHAARRGGRGTTSLTLGVQNEIRELTVTADLAGQRSSVRVSGWDVAGKSALSEEATDDTIRNELGSDTSGASLLGSASFGERKESLVHTVPLGQEEARARAESFFRAGARRFVRARGVAQTDARLRVGVKVDIRAAGPLFSGSYYVVEVRHTFDGARGLRTEFVAERPGIGRDA
jgi:phage protein D